jgi:hypothetical protein
MPPKQCMQSKSDLSSSSRLFGGRRVCAVRHRHPAGLAGGLLWGQHPSQIPGCIMFLQAGPFGSLVGAPGAASTMLQHASDRHCERAVLVYSACEVFACESKCGMYDMDTLAHRRPGRFQPCCTADPGPQQPGVKRRFCCTLQPLAIALNTPDYDISDRVATMTEQQAVIHSQHVMTWHERRQQRA